MNAATSSRREFEVLPQQADFVECECLFSAAYGGVGSGKTFSAQWKMWKRLRRYPRAGHYVVGADFEQLRGGYFLDVRNLLEDLLGWKETRDFKYRENPRPTIILLDSGARIRALSSELAERIRSTQIQSLHAEEPQTWHNGEQVWKTLVGRMRHSIRSAQIYGGMPIQAWLTFNPGGNPGAPVGSWLYKLLEEQWRTKKALRCAACRARDPEAEFGYPSWRFSLRDNYLLPNVEQYIENLETTLSPAEWPIEIDGHFPTSGGSVYRGYDERVHAAPPPEGLPTIGLQPGPLLWTLDFNVAWQCSIIAQAHVQRPIVEFLADGRHERFPAPTCQRRVFYALDEIVIPDSGVEDLVPAFLARYGEHARKYGVTIYGDASGGARSQLISGSNAIRSNWARIRSDLRAANVDVKMRVQRANPHEWNRVNATNAQFGTSAGIGAFIAPACETLKDDFRLVRNVAGENKIDKTDKSKDGLKRTHSSDAWGYLVWVERQLEAQPNSIEWLMVR